ncbi:MAG: SLC13 family permease [Candidatus Brocadiia bacterium]
MDPQILTAIIFCIVYGFIIFSKRYVAVALWIGIGALCVLPLLWGQKPVVNPQDLFLIMRQEDGWAWASINWNVIGIFSGTLLIAQVFIYSRVPAVMSDWLVAKSPNVGWAILGVCAMASFISMFADNVATVLIVAPIAMELAKKLDVSPAPFLIGIAISSNLQGTATLIGDPPSMILAAEYRMNFAEFFVQHGRAGVFWAVQFGAIAGFFVLWLMFRKYRQSISEQPSAKPRSWVPTILLVGMIVALAFGSLVDADFMWFGGTVCLTAGALGITWLWHQNRENAVRILRSFDWSTCFFLMGVFMMVFALKEGQSDIIPLLAEGVRSLTGDSILTAFILIVAVSMFLSGFIDNIPYLAAMLPLVQDLTGHLGGLEANNMVLAFGLLIGSCLGGNITPVGASANVVSYGMLRRMGEGTSFWDFVKIGLPFTLAATTASSLFVWVVWMVL